MAPNPDHTEIIWSPKRRNWRGKTSERERERERVGGGGGGGGGGGEKERGGMP